MAFSLYTITVLGVSLTVKTSENVQYLKKLESLLDTAILDVQESLSVRDPLSVAIMAGFFLSDQLQKEIDLKDDSLESIECEKKISTLISFLDRSV